jgi:allantoin racemase
MRILLANSNISAQVTEAVVAAARAVAAPGTEIVGRNARFGARIIGTRTEAAVAAHGLVDLLAEHAPGADAVVIAMSFDTGLWAAREMLDVPVVGMTEAACLMACTLAPRFGLVTLRARGTQPYREVVESYGLGGRLAGLVELDAAPEDLLRDPAALDVAILEAVGRLVENDGAEAVVLAGAVMAGVPGRLAARAAVPLVDGIAAGVLMAETLARLGPAKSRTGSLQRLPPRQTDGLGPALTRLLEGGDG